MAGQDKHQDNSEATSTADFAATVERLEALVEKLESGELSLEDSLTAFEQGVRLTRDAQRQLDDAELKVRSLTEGENGGMDLKPFATPEEDGGGH
ncbi:exodeoxyribonuclease VII small subunit [Halomonas sp. 18H]|uniref:exodeoxyribonuclease VII small subunit n=1 Tax=Halomonas almeriensis TaxID=308163 RepID=UPI002230C861|nr:MULTISPECIES: exodeoxyribonuclease VII small subunit [Halomonas]MCW4152011.1 exodeoxyribonuclease VII small subunit [Halomonas sp. 18H]MDN3552447.1 exodeoxyribonuclease VII small subunit [Halomonas almeriensis]